MNKARKGERGVLGLLKRFDEKVKSGVVLAAFGLVIVFAAWQVFHAEDTANEVPVYATETETKVLRLLQEIDGVGEANVIVYEKDGCIENVVVVCEGANNVRVVMNVREAVASALGTEQNSVKIYLKKE